MSQLKIERSESEHTTVQLKPSFSLGISPYVLTGEKLMLIPTMPEHCHALHSMMFSNPKVMKYLGSGKTFTANEYWPHHLRWVNENLQGEYNKNTGCLSVFSWTVVTHEGIAGRFKISKKEGKTEIGYSLFPAVQGRGIARRASELAVSYLGEETPLIATAHPKNIASAKTLEGIQYPDKKFAFFRDPERQNVPNVYENQPRDYFLSKNNASVSWFSFYKRSMQHTNVHSSAMDCAVEFQK